MKKQLLCVAVLLLGFSFISNAQTSNNEKAAREWIKSHAKELNLTSDTNLNLRFARKGLAGETLRFQQMVNDVPVFESEVLIHFNPNGEITHTSTNNIDKNITLSNVVPSISSQDALSIAYKELKSTGTISFQESKLYVYNKTGAPRLAYKITIVCDDKPGDWEIFVDANTSGVISSKDVSLNHHKTEIVSNEKKTSAQKENGFERKALKSPNAFVTGSGMVFNADPLSSAHVTYGGNYVDNNDATNASLDAARVSVVLPEIDFTAGVYRLKSSYIDILDFENPKRGLFTQANNAFNFTRDVDGFEAVNSFYHLDKSMRYINETLGIACRPQQNSGVLMYDPHGLNGQDNSHFIPSSDRIAFGEGCVDDAEDADVVLHEFGHGIHDWMTGGAASSSEGLGEGSGDYWAQSYSRSLNQWLTTDAAYHYMFSWDGHNECWGGRITNYAAVYPSGLTGTIHTDGQIWATSLMKIYDVIGRTKTDKAFLEGLALTNGSSLQQNAAVAVRQAAIDMNYSCADIKVFTDKFTQTGYVMPAIPLRINCPGTQIVNADAGGNYTVPNFSALANAINSNCDAVVTQSPAVGSVVGVGTYTVTMTATSGTSVNCAFSLVVQSNLGVQDIVKNSFVIYPNPASSSITIKGDGFDNEEVEIYNMLGQKVIQRALIANESTLDISKLANGVYSIYFVNAKVSRKFVKQ